MGKTTLDLVLDGKVTVEERDEKGELVSSAEIDGKDVLDVLLMTIERSIATLEAAKDRDIYSELKEGIDAMSDERESRTPKFMKLDPAAKIPTRGSSEAAGLDLYANQEFVLTPGDRAVVKTGVAMQLPYGYVGLVCPRSGLASKAGVTVLNAPGIVDSDYRGELMVILVNHGRVNHIVCAGDRIAQLVIQKVELLDPVEVEVLEETDRGAGGLGSTGK